MKKQFLSLFVLLGAPLFVAASSVTFGSNKDIIRAIDKTLGAPFVSPTPELPFDLNGSAERALNQIKNILIESEELREEALKLFEATIQRYSNPDYNRDDFDLGRNSDGLGLKILLQTIAQGYHDSISDGVTEPSWKASLLRHGIIDKTGKYRFRR